VEALSRLIGDLGAGCSLSLLPPFVKYGVIRKIGEHNYIHKCDFNVIAVYYAAHGLEGQYLDPRKWYPATERRVHCALSLPTPIASIEASVAHCSRQCQPREPNVGHINAKEALNL
jgi:hypothetical protein